jgi:carbon storage regulator CsrA
MLVLSRKVGEKIIIGNRMITLVVVSYDPIRKQVKLGLDADDLISINREEIFLRLEEELKDTPEFQNMVWSLPREVGKKARQEFEDINPEDGIDIEEEDE